MDVPTPKCDPINEIRFAVVMYGGVSLAIYINGVTQELLDMVRATAPAKADGDKLLVPEEELTGAMSIYRRLGRFLESGDDRLQWLETKPEPLKDASGDEKKKWSEWDSARKSAPVRTRFIVDVISGTSAGGINGLFLSKALANNQSLGGLKKLWVTEGDLAKLLNDKFSVADLRECGMSVLEPRQSLLNSQRMYRKLLEALDSMEPPEDARPEDRSPLVAELDLFVTTTDIEGLPLPIKLADKLVYERRHRNVFHFRYHDPGAPGISEASQPNVPSQPDEQKQQDKQEKQEAFNDFVKPNDPFLAYAARCTSSFPFAFEPMQLSDIKSVVENFGSGLTYDISKERIKKWEKFFSEYLRGSVWNIRRALAAAEGNGAVEPPHEDLVERFWKRSFGDGGYLDNKPFSHATAMLMRRTATVPVERKLVYIEPAPEHPERLPASSEKPDFLQNVNAALGLPRRETIREDLDRLFERNEMLERIGTLAKNVDADVARLPFKYDDALNTGQFKKAGLAKLINLYGVGFGSYHRLKLDEVTSMLSERVARAIGFDPASEEGAAIREVMECWRKKRFVADPENSETSENEFLLYLDLRYCLRRIGFTARRLNEISRLDDRANDLIAIAAKDIWGGDDKQADTKITERLRNDPRWRQLFLDELTEIKKDKVSPALAKNRNLEERLHFDPFDVGNPPQETTLKKLACLIFNWDCLQPIMAAALPQRAKLAKSLVDRKTAEFDHLDEFFRAAFKNAGGRPITEPGDNDFDGPRVVARRVVEHFRRKFPLYDLVTYPVLAGSGAREATVVKVSRISPEDAEALGKKRATPAEKLAGTTLMNFGAFLQRAWRQNDMLWGRLDGAERLICAVFEPKDDAEKKVRQDLIMEAQIAILKQDLDPADRETVARLITEFVSQREPGTESERALRRLIETNLGEEKNLSGKVGAVLRGALGDPKKLWDFYDESFEVDRRVDAENAVRLVARGTDIVGRMLQQLAEAKKVEPAARIAKRIAILGRVFWQAVEVAVPRSLPHLFFRHWIGLLYLFDFVFIVGGILFGRPEVKNFGWLLLALTVTANVIVSALTEYITGRETVFRVVRTFVALLLITLVTGGFLFFGSQITQIDDEQQLLVASVTAASLGLLVAFAEWRRGLRELRERAREGVHWGLLLWLTGVTAAFMAVLRWLEKAARINQGDMARLELAGNATSANGVLDHWPIDQVRVELFVDFGFLISYSALLATACFAVARLWKARAIAREAKFAAEGKPEATSRDRPIKWLRFAATASFLIGGFQWMAGGCDAVENIALLAFLRDRTSDFMPEIARWSASGKFVLVIVGCFCASGGFLFAPAKPWKVRLGYAAFALLLAGAGGIFARAFLHAF